MSRCLLALLLVGCAAALPATRMATPDERDLVDAALEAYVAARGPVLAASLDHVEVVPVDAETLEARCHRPRVRACVFELNRSPFSPLSTRIYVADWVDAGTHERLLIHEALHVIRRAHWSESGRDPEVLRMGATELCPITTAADHGHCDVELWRQIEHDARARAEGQR